MKTNKQLRELAESATPGPWYRGHDSDVSVSECGDEVYLSWEVAGPVQVHARFDDYQGRQANADADFCAAASPDTILALLDEIEALQAEREDLRTALAESRANDQQAMAYLSEVRAIVGGDDFPDMVRRCERLQAKCARLQAAMIEAKGHISHYMYGGSSYREPAVAAIELIDDALQGGAADDN